MTTVRQLYSFSRRVFISILKRLPVIFCHPFLHLPKFRNIACPVKQAQGQYKHIFLSPGRAELIPGLLQKNPRALAKARALLSGVPQKPTRLDNFFEINKKPAFSFAHTKVAIVAHWDPHQILDPYVSHYLKSLKDLGYNTILASAHNLFLPVEAENFVDASVWRMCSGYDFTSWKASLAAFPDLFKAEELLLTNDSIFCPVGDLRNVHKAMAKVPCDFWGMLEQRNRSPHIQSYYLLLRKAAIAHPSFKSFMDGVDCSPFKKNAVQYEATFSLWLATNGLVPGAFIPQDRDVGYTARVFWKQCIKHGMPSLKRNLFSLSSDIVMLEEWRKTVSEAGYPVAFIENYFQRLGIRLPD